MFPIGARIEYTSRKGIVFPGVVDLDLTLDLGPGRVKGVTGNQRVRNAHPEEVHPRGTYIFLHKDIVYMYLPWCSTGTRRKLEVVHELNGLLAKTDLAENQISEVFVAALQSVRAPHLLDCNSIFHLFHYHFFDLNQ